MSEPVDPERYLRRVERRLPFEGDERAEIIEELAAHLADCEASYRDQGMDAEAAGRAAVERLGSPEKLADELTKARRSNTRLLQAAGAGIWGALRGGAWGGLLGLGFMLLAYLALVALADIGRYQLGVYPDFGPDDATLSIIPALGIGVVLMAAGRVVTPSVAARGALAGRVARRVTVPAGAALALAYGLAGWSGSLNWASALAWLALPVWWVAGTWQTRPIGLDTPERTVRLLATAIGTVFAICLLSTGTYPWSAAYQETPQDIASGFSDQHYERIAPDAPSDIQAALLSFNMTTGSVGRPVVSIVLSDRAVLSDWSDLRVEAWRGSLSSGMYEIDPAATGPLATAPAQWVEGARSLDGVDLTDYESQTPLGPPLRCRAADGTWTTRCPAPQVSTLSGEAVVQTTEPAFVFLVISGRAPDGDRYLIGKWNGEEWVSFRGTALDWLEASLAGH